MATYPLRELLSRWQQGTLTIQPIAKLVRGWLKAGIVDQGETLFPEAGVPQGGVISPLLRLCRFQDLD